MNDYESQSSDDEDGPTLTLKQVKQKKDRKKKADKLKKKQAKLEEDKNGMFSGVKSFFRISKKEEQMRKKDSTETKKLPKNFANKVLDYELKIDSG